MLESQSHLFEAFLKAAAAYAACPAITSKDPCAPQQLTYSELCRQAVQLGHFLKAKGIGPQDKVALILGNQPEYAVTFFAIMSAGATAVPLDNQFPSALIQNILLHCRAKLLIATQAVYEKIKLNTHVEIFIFDAGTLQARENEESPQPDFAPGFPSDSLAVIFYTSGTTEVPKGVMLSHVNLLANVRSLQDLKIVQPGDAVISILPLHHAYSFTATLLVPLFSGARIVYPASLNSADLLACLCQEKIAIFVGVPQVFSQIHRSIDARIKKLPLLKRAAVEALGKACYSLRKTFRLNLSKKLFKDIHKNLGPSLRFLISGGARLDPGMAADFEKWGFVILEGYGLTETSPVVSFNPPGAPKIGSVGKAIKDVEIRIVEPDADGRGEVVVRGPNVMVGYFDLPEQTRAVLKDNWFYTGDIGFLDRDEYLHLVGRKKEIIVLSSGKNIDPEKVERHYGRNPYVKEIAVLATPVQGLLKGIEQLAAVVVINEEQFRSANEINIREKLKWEFENLSLQLPSYERITGFVISKDNLPRTRLGKIMRYRLAELYGDLSLAASGLSLPQAVRDSGANDVSLFALHQFEEVLGKKVNLRDHLELDLGLDSLTRIELLLALQERLNLKVSDEENMDFFLCQTVEELLNQFKKFIPAGSLGGKEQNVLQWNEVLKEMPSEVTLKKIKTSFAWWEIAVNVFFIAVFKVFFKMFFFLRVEGRKNLPPAGPYIICANHATYLDGLIIFSALPYKSVLDTYFVGYSAILEKGLIRSFIKIGRLIPISVSFNLMEAFKACSFVLRHSKVLCYFPEGQRSIDGELNEFKKGIGILVKELNVPVVPAYIEGAFKAWPRGRRFPRIGPIKVRFGPVLTPQALGAEDAAPEKSSLYKNIARNLQQQVMALRQKPSPSRWRSLY